MDQRLQARLACPSCRSGLVFAGEERNKRVWEGEFSCLGCSQSFKVVGEVPVLVAPGAPTEGVLGETFQERVREWIPKNFERQQKRPGELAKLDELVRTVQSLEGVILDIASGPGGSLCVPVMTDGRTDRLLVMSDLGRPVMVEWRRLLREVGWGDRCSNMVFDARSIPFRDDSVAAITSMGGFDNIIDNKPAYAEAGRVLRCGGMLLDMVTFFEEGGKTQKFLLDHGQAAPDRQAYLTMLDGLGFGVERSELLNEGRGKKCPGDCAPFEEEKWQDIVVYARKLD